MTAGDGAAMTSEKGFWPGWSKLLLTIMTIALAAAGALILEKARSKGAANGAAALSTLTALLGAGWAYGALKRSATRSRGVDARPWWIREISLLNFILLAAPLAGSLGSTSERKIQAGALVAAFVLVGLFLGSVLLSAAIARGRSVVWGVLLLLGGAASVYGTIKGLKALDRADDGLMKTAAILSMVGFLGNAVVALCLGAGKLGDSDELAKKLAPALRVAFLTYLLGLGLSSLLASFGSLPDKISEFRDLHTALGPGGVFTFAFVLFAASVAWRESAPTEPAST